MSELEQSNVTNCDEQHQNPAYYTSNILQDEEANINEEEVGFGSLKRKGPDHVEEDGVKEDCNSKSSEQSKQQKRARSAEVHNLNERLRRQRLKEKIKALQELIPNCSKRDKSSTFDDAIKYIKTLQYQVQVMSMGAGYSPPTMMPHPQKQPLQIPNSVPFLTTTPPSIEINYGIGTGTGMGIPAIFPSSLDFPTTQTGLPNHCLLPASAASGMPLNFACPVVLSPASIESHGSKSACQGLMSASSQGPIQSSTRREPTTRVLPSKIVEPHHSKEVMDYGCSHSGSNEGSSSSTAKWKNSSFQNVISLLEEADVDDEGGP